MTQEDGDKKKGGFMDKIKYQSQKAAAKTGLNLTKMKENTQISMLEKKLTNRKQKFGLDYMTAVLRGDASSQTLQSMVKQAKDDCLEIMREIDEHQEKIDDQEGTTQEKIRTAKVEHNIQDKPPKGTN